MSQVAGEELFTTEGT